MIRSAIPICGGERQGAAAQPGLGRQPHNRFTTQFKMSGFFIKGQTHTEIDLLKVNTNMNVYVRLPRGISEDPDAGSSDSTSARGPTQSSRRRSGVPLPLLNRTMCPTPPPQGVPRCRRPGGGPTASISVCAPPPTQVGRLRVRSKRRSGWRMYQSCNTLLIHQYCKYF